MHTLSIIAIIVILATLVVLARRQKDMAMVLVIANMSVFIISLFSVPNINISTWGWVQQELGFRASHLGDPLQAWTLLTHMFLHADVMHLLFNMLFLLLIGTQLESRVGKGRFLAIYFLGGLLAALTQSFMQWTPLGLQSDSIMVGASGAISALMGAMLMLYPRDEIPFFLGPLFLPRVKVWLSVGTWFLLQGLFLITASGGGVAYAAHIGGFIAGAAIARATVSWSWDAQTELDSDWKELEDLAVTVELQKALQEIRNADEPEVLSAWLEYFQERAVCPVCGGHPHLKGHKLSCACGWDRRIL
ncbi:MAG: rhomboid family intramembrane serine protease [Candidatus Methanomethylophilaceae archaeon]